MKALIAKLFLAITGWKLEGEVPEDDRVVLIAAPHTTNWDFAYLLALGFAHGYHVNWMGKHSLFRAPFGGIMRALGGVPVQRDRRTDLVSRMAKIFEEREHLVLTIPPEGTRGLADHWKSGFYQIAMAAKVPVHLGYLDYPSRRGGFGPAIQLTGDVKADMDVIRAFYADKRGKYPENFTPIRLNEESPSD